MSSNRNSRTRLVTAAATVALAALSLTACSDGTGARDEGASAGSSPAGSPAASTPASKAPASGSNGASANGSEGTPNGASSTGTSSDDAKPTANTPASKGPASSGKAVTCQGSNTKTVAAPLTRPINHMLLTVTNTGSNTCYLYGYPAVQFGEAQSVPPVDEDTHPQAVVTLKPGESGYASVLLSGADGSTANGHTEKSLTVHFSGRSDNENVAPAHPSLPADGMYIDDSLKVTYWQQSLDDVIAW
ncbi:DUF4232 domain-containing protein [Streptomyces sp. E11-3]|uniref:DUF4232 domain-containing protein n=1 Tax=Streptomyces sp. E11-3 TaxID=3110112 RepID=UPI00397F74A8